MSFAPRCAVSGYFVSLLIAFFALAAPEPPPVPLPFLPDVLLVAAFFAAPSTFLPMPATSLSFSVAIATNVSTLSIRC